MMYLHSICNLLTVQSTIYTAQECLLPVFVNEVSSLSSYSNKLKDGVDSSKAMNLYFCSFVLYGFGLILLYLNKLTNGFTLAFYTTF